MCKKMEIKRVNKDSCRVKNGHPSSSIKNLNTIKNVIISKKIAGVDVVVEAGVANNTKIVINANRTMVATSPRTNIKMRVTSDNKTMIIAGTTTVITTSQNLIMVVTVG